MGRTIADTQKRQRPTAPRIRNVHLQWPLDFADRVDAIVAERGMTKQEIVLRVLHQAMETGALYEWITKPVTTSRRPQEAIAGG